MKAGSRVYHAGNFGHDAVWVRKQSEDDEHRLTWYRLRIICKRMGLI